MTDKSKELAWWWSADRERYRGPSWSRADAIMEAWGDGETGVIFVCQADQGAVTTDLLDGDRLAEMFDDANDETSDPDGDPLSENIKADVWAKMAERCNVIIKAEVTRAGVKSWSFTHQTSDETVDLSVGIALAKGRDEMREALENAATWFREYAHNHDQKGTPEAAEKAKTNRDRADACELALQP